MKKTAKLIFFDLYSDKLFTINANNMDITKLSKICTKITLNIELEKILRKKGYPGVLNKDKSIYILFRNKNDSVRFFDSNK